MKLKIIQLFGTAMLFAVFLVMLWTFYTAYFNPSKTTLVDINSIGEAQIEAWIIMPMVLIFGLLSLLINLYDCINDKTEK